MDKLTLNISKDVATIEEGADSTISKLIAGCKGRVIIKSPFGDRLIKVVKSPKGKIIRSIK